MPVHRGLSLIMLSYCTMTEEASDNKLTVELLKLKGKVADPQHRPFPTITCTHSSQAFEQE